MNAFISRYATSGKGVRLAVKDLIDMEGEPTTAGCRAVATRAEPASADADCLAGARAAQARIVGRTNLHELAFGVTGVNPWFGTPVNPLDPTRVPGGSSSGSAVAVATGEADVAYGSDTGGSIRIPAACCGTVGLKTTWGRVALGGVWPLAPSLDTIGPMARDVAGAILGMALLEPGFATLDDPVDSLRVGRVPLAAEPTIWAAIDRALHSAGWACRSLPLHGWEEATRQATVVMMAEAWRADRWLVERDPDGIGRDVLARLERGSRIDSGALSRAGRVQRAWKTALGQAFEEVDILVAPTLRIFPPRLDEGDELLAARCTLPVNLAGLPALALPIPAAGGFPTSVQLIGALHSEEHLLAAGAHLEAAIASG